LRLALIEKTHRKTARMARDQIDMTPIETRDELVAWFEAGCKPKTQFRAGTEHEKFAFTIDHRRPVPYDGRRSIRALLEGLHSLLGWDPIMEGDNIIGMFDVTGGGAISLEPGGQFELSGAPVETVHQTASELLAHLSQLREVAAPLGIGFLGMGMTPDWSRADMPKMPKGRYNIMTNYMPKVGSRGLDMMYRTCTVQTNLDFSSEADMVKKLRVSIALQPVATALFANSPFTEGKPNGLLSMRSEIWRDTDNNRAGMLPFAFQDGMGFERYVDYALDVPMYFVKRGDNYIDLSGRSFRDFFAGKLPDLPGQRPTVSDWANHVSTIFPEVRLKRYLEMRGADGGPWRRLPSLTAYWVGLLYDDEALDGAWELVKGWTAEERQKLRDEVPRRGFKALIRDTNVHTLAAETLRLARRGLEKRGRLDRNGRDETRFLRPLEEIVARGITPAEELLEKYFNEWNESVAPIYDQYAY
jgi:glutamate--cysteine ligase